MTQPADPLTTAIVKMKAAGRPMPQNEMQAWSDTWNTDGLSAEEANAYVNAAASGGNLQQAWNQMDFSQFVTPQNGDPTLVRDNGPQSTAGPMGTGFTPGPFSVSSDPNEPYLTGEATPLPPTADPSVTQYPNGMVSKMDNMESAPKANALQNLLAQLTGRRAV